jgi:hypothetical protein
MWFTMAVAASHLHLGQLVGDHVPTPGDFVILPYVAVNTLNPRRHVNIYIWRGRIVSVLIVGTTGRTQMAARAHLVGRPLRSLGDRKQVDPLDGRKTKRAILVLDDGPLILRAVAEQTIHIS